MTESTHSHTLHFLDVISPVGHLSVCLCVVTCLCVRMVTSLFMSVSVWGVPRRQPYRCSGLATLPSVGAVP